MLTCNYEILCIYCKASKYLHALFKCQEKVQLRVINFVEKRRLKKSLTDAMADWTPVDTPLDLGCYKLCAYIKYIERTRCTYPIHRKNASYHPILKYALMAAKRCRCCGYPLPPSDAPFPHSNGNGHPQHLQRLAAIKAYLRMG